VAARRLRGGERLCHTSTRAEIPSAHWRQTMRNTVRLFYYDVVGQSYTLATWVEVLDKVSRVPGCYSIRVTVGALGTVQIHVV
jgi:hypothetical protein